MALFYDQNKRQETKHKGNQKSCLAVVLLLHSMVVVKALTVELSH